MQDVCCFACFRAYYKFLYMGYMLCIASAGYMFVYYIFFRNRREHHDKKEEIFVIFRYIASSIVGVTLSLIIVISVMYALSKGKGNNWLADIWEILTNLTDGGFMLSPKAFLPIHFWGMI